MNPQSYEARIRRVLDYIYANPGGDLSLDTLAEVAAMSRFHWHRVFRAITGESCAQAVRRVRMHRAAFWLVQTDMSLGEIAAQLGYHNTQSFTRGFRELHGCTPAALRKQGLHTENQMNPMTITPREGDLTMYQVSIRELPKRRLAALAHSGAYHEIGKSFEQVGLIFTTRKLWAEARGMVAIYYDNPEEVAEADLRSHAGVSVGDGFNMPEGLEDVVIEGGPTAVLSYKGPYTRLPQVYEWFYGQWLPQSGRVPADRPSYEIYLNSPADTAPNNLMTEIAMPLLAE